MSNRKRTRKNQRAGAGSLTTYPPRLDAVEAIAAAVADKQHWVLSVPPVAAMQVVDRLSTTTAVYWTEMGVDEHPALRIAATPDRAGHYLAGMTASSLGLPLVVVIDKAGVAPSLLADLLGHRVPDDGSQDVVIWTWRDKTAWPLLLLDAFQLVDPAGADTIRKSCR